MTNLELIKAAHIWALAVLLACGLLAFAVKAGTGRQEQQNSNSNSNQNSNSNTNSNTNTANANRSQNDNGNRRANRNTGDQAGMGNPDQKFLMDAAIGGLMEVELGRWAVQKGTSDAVKQFGRRMVDDHSQANSELATLAASKGITLPTSLDEKHQKEVAKLTRLSGAAFDRAYAKMMVKDHEKAVSDFEKESTRGADADLKAFATKTLPTLQEHLQMARALDGTQRGNSNSSGSGSNRSTNRNSNSNSNSNRNNNGNSNNSNRP